MEKFIFKNANSTSAQPPKDTMKERRWILLKMKLGKFYFSNENNYLRQP